MPIRTIVQCEQCEREILKGCGVGVAGNIYAVDPAQPGGCVGGIVGNNFPSIPPITGKTKRSFGAKDIRTSYYHTECLTQAIREAMTE